MKGLASFCCFAVVAAVALLCCTPTQAADWSWAESDSLAQAPIVKLPAGPLFASQAAAASEQCVCGDGCQCSGQAVTLASQVKAVRTAEQSKWNYTPLPGGGWMATPKMQAVRTATPVSWYSDPTYAGPGGGTVITYADDEPVCVGGSCSMPTSSYTSGRYTSWVPQSYGSGGYSSSPRTYSSGPIRRLFGGGFRSCGPNGCN